MRKLTICVFLLAAAGCGKEAARPVAAEAPPTFPAGEYEIVSDVTKLASTDKTVPATKLKMGDKQTIRACVAADGTPDPAMFVETGDRCTAINSYARSGRLSVQYDCDRPGKGKIYPNADGNFTADGYQAVVTVASSFAGDGDYTLTRMLTAKRIGVCPPAATKI